MPCFRLMDDGSLTRVRNGIGRRSTSSPSRPPESSISSRSKPPGSPSAALVSGRKGTVLQPGTRPIRVGQCHDSTDAYLRESRGGAETVPNRSTHGAKGVRHHTRRQVRWFDPSGSNGVRRADRSAAPGGPQLVRRVEKTRACNEVASPFSAPRSPPRSRARSAAGASGIRSRATRYSPTPPTIAPSRLVP